VSTQVSERPYGARDTVAGFLSAVAVFVGLLAAGNIALTINGVSIAFQPVRVGVAAELVSFVALGMSTGRSRFPSVAVALCGLLWFTGMVVAVITNRPLW